MPTNTLRKSTFSTTLLFISTAIAALCAEPLTVDNMEAGDRMLTESVHGEHTTFQLWPDDGKRADDPLKDQLEIFDTRIRKVSRPTVMVMKAAKPNGKAVVVFPGGGYGHLAAKKEGSLVGEWLNKQGITAFVVKYRVGKRKGIDVAFQDGQRAVRFARRNAKAFHIDPDKIGVMGFSAGGHLSANLIHNFDTASYPPADELDELSSKPDFGVLIYPAYLGGKTEASEEVSEVKDATIPIYIAISEKDSFIVGVKSYLPVLEKAGVPHEFHAYDTGKHGTGLGGFPWIAPCEKWLAEVRP